MADHDIAGLRQSYGAGRLDESGVGNDPIALFERWMRHALDAEVPEPHAMALATVDADGRPSSRIVLCRGAGEHGFRFFTNYGGRKAREIDETARAALTFFWQPLERQVRAEGTVERLSTDASDAYFAGRPRASQLGAWASPQSERLANRAELERRLKDVEERFRDAESVPRPEFWGGYVVRPERIEFWQGRPDRLHDRIEFTRRGDDWQRARLAP